MLKGNPLSKIDTRIHAETHEGLVDDAPAPRGGGGVANDSRLIVMSPHGPISTCNSFSKSAAEGVVKELNRALDVARSRLWEKTSLPEKIDTAWLSRQHKQGHYLFDVLDGDSRRLQNTECEKPDYLGVHASAPMIAWLRDMDGSVPHARFDLKTLLDEEMGEEQCWWCLTDEGDAWWQAEGHSPVLSESPNPCDPQQEAYLRFLELLVSGPAPVRSLKQAQGRPLLTGIGLLSRNPCGDLIMPLLQADMEPLSREDFVMYAFEFTKAQNRLAYGLMAWHLAQGE